MIKHTLALALTFSAVSLPTAASAATQITQSLDTNSSWTVKNLTTNVTTTAVVPSSVPGSYNAPGNAPVNGAQYIYPTSTTNAPGNTTFAFTRVFSIPAFAQLSTARLIGTLWADNNIVSILLNGVLITNPVVSGTQSFNGPGIALNTGGNFLLGTNTVVFNVFNQTGSGENPVSLRADLAAVYAVPEPGTWMLMLLGFGAIGFAMRSRAKTRVRFQFA